ncbi:MAG: hypothetical protein A2Z01_02980 [Betaproteobacteria bacterium RBG_16_58_11]|nr:MAG: hypothetical protein A2Z01_02980 [Betaproteobacteria bacterium RBG_16_58_11]OGA00157.1 MAG: hypothetical protein A2Z44_08480 [Betaproteobacteria bacterium RBG_19FT_COMBO_58_11]
MKRVLIFIVAVLLLAISFTAGGLRERLKESAEKEANYPWNLHRQIANSKLDCEKLKSEKAKGDIFSETLDGGKVILITSFNVTTQMITVSAIDAQHRVATDTWQLQCSA